MIHHMCDMLVELSLLVISHQAIKSHPHLVMCQINRDLLASSKTVMGTGLSDTSFSFTSTFLFSIFTTSLSVFVIKNDLKKNGHLQLSSTLTIFSVVFKKSYDGNILDILERNRLF